MTEMLPATTLASLPPGNFLENLDRGRDGALYVTSYVGRQLMRYDGSELVPVVDLDRHPVGIAFGSDGVAVVSTHERSALSRAGVGANGIVLARPDGGWTHLMDVPGAGFLNGVFRLATGRFLVADSLASTVWMIDIATKSATPWLVDALLAPTETDFIAANGIKRFGDRLYISNSAQRTLLSVDLGGDLAPGKLRVEQRDLLLDDFAFDSDGTLYGATHHEVVVKVTGDGTRSIIAGPDEGVEGSTAVMLGADGDDGLYVVTDGGLFQGGNGPARLVRLSRNTQ